MRAGAGIERHRFFAVADDLERGVPFGMQLLRRARRHPGGETFVEPQVVPPLHRHQVAEPLVGDLVRGDRKHALAVGLGGDRRVEQQGVFEGIDRAPVLHRAEELAAAGRGDVVEFRQGIWDGEILVVFAQHVVGRVQGETRLVEQTRLRHDTDLGIAELDRGAFEIAESEEQQVGGHLRRSGETHALAAVAEFDALRNRHVADGHLRRGHDRFEGECRLVVGLVPGRNEAPRIGVLELGVQRALVAGLRRVIDREQAVGLGADLAGVGQDKAMTAGRQGLRENEAGRLVRRVDLDLRRRERGLSVGRQHARRRKAHVHRLQHDAIGGSQHFEMDRGLAVETELVGMRLERNLVMPGAHVARQLRRDLRPGVGAQRRREREPGEGQGDGDGKGSVHGRT